MFATPAMAQTANAAAESGGIAALLGGPLPLLVLMFVLFYFLILRPQNKRMKDHQGMLGGLKRGDTVVLSSGIIGKVTKVDDAEAQVEIAPNTVVKVVKSTISEVRTRGEPAAANDPKN